MIHSHTYACVCVCIYVWHNIHGCERVFMYEIINVIQTCCCCVWLQCRRLYDSPESCHTFQSVLLPHISVAQRTENATLCESENATLCESYYCIFLVLAIPLSHVTRLNESYHTFECVMSHVWMSHVTRLNESCHTYKWVLLHVQHTQICGMGWLWLVGSIKLQVSFAKEPYKKHENLRKRPIILSILLTVATP